MDFLKTKKYDIRFSLLSEAVRLALRNESGLWLEFGVATASTINFISELNPNQTIFGFDSFEGLPEDWGTGMPKGTFTTNGVLPEVNQNVTLIRGWFKDVLPNFLKKYPKETISFLHIDCDIYSSTVDVLTNCRDKIVKGTIICFDEFYNYPNYENHEYKAWKEYTEKYNVKYQYIGHVSSDLCSVDPQQVLVEVL